MKPEGRQSKEPVEGKRRTEQKVTTSRNVAEFYNGEH